VENLGVLLGRSLICYGASRQREECHSRPGEWHLENEIRRFKIWALGQQRLQIEFSGVYEYKTPRGPTANEGEGSGIATIDGDIAIFKPEGAEEECRITLKFTGSKLLVSQTGICGFGHNVSAAGTYKRVSATKPKFESN
jgi:hypothetical protein